MRKAPHWEAYFWFGGGGRTRPGHSGAHSHFCDLYLSPCLCVRNIIKSMVPKREVSIDIVIFSQLFLLTY